MAKLLGELLFATLGAFIRSCVYSFLEQAVLKWGAWLDTKVQGRTAKLVLGILLGLAAYFLIPIAVGLFSL
jgi:hypothetical protein